MLEAEQIMKRCQIGTRNYEEANNLHAECFRIIGKLLAERTEQEPVGDDIASIIACRDMLDAQPVPPRRTLVGLTDEDIGDAYVAWDDTDGASFADFARAIEAKLKEKNCL